ncbi:hypothetical protein F5148DRAFT_1149443 [Russula earlei]|uniref:Uncharacterized protein n=1 Tax=Russula earlei TaxID=71964 RepID=A0ACC0U8D2_9AGAM|nr:hypothetical protein F5148DRAFT_1149443 [Russula earlei]
MASFAALPLMDASRDSRIHDWIAEQYSFALSEFQDDYLWRDDPPSLRESKLLPDDFDLIIRPPSSSQPDIDHDRDAQSTHSNDPPLLPSPLPLHHRAPSHHRPAQSSADLEDALDGLLREMNSWRIAPASRSALTLRCSDRNKALPPPPSPSLPPTPTLENFPSPPATAPSSPTSSSFPVTPTSSFRPLHRRSKALDQPPSPPESDSEPTLTSSASYASLRSRGNRYPSISTTLSTAESTFTPSVRHAIYISAPKESPPPSPTTPTPVERMPPAEVVSSTPSPDPLPPASMDKLLQVYPSGLAAGESSRWSVASTSLPSRRSPTPTPNSMPILPTFIRPSSKPKRELTSIRTRILSTFGLRSRDSTPPSPTTANAFPSNPRRNSYRSSWSSATTRRRHVDSHINMNTLNTSRCEKRLVVSGLEKGNLDAELAVKRWCESFGELRRISRKDGALHVSWKKASVADTVCRLEARVYIKGVGSVGLSWVTEPRLF